MAPGMAARWCSIHWHERARHGFWEHWFFPSPDDAAKPSVMTGAFCCRNCRHDVEIISSPSQRNSARAVACGESKHARLSPCL